MPRFKGTPRRLNEDSPSVSEPKKKKSRKASKSLNNPCEIKLEAQITECNFPYKLGSITFVLRESHDIKHAETFVIIFKSESQSCSLCWNEVDENNDSQEMTLPAIYETPYDILQTLCVLKICKFVTHSSILVEGNNSIDIYLDSSTFISLESASHPYFNHQRRKVYDLLNYFLKVEFEDYEDDDPFEGEQVEKIYGSIVNSYNPTFVDDSVSHDSLIPTLRKYQSQAVHWMLKQEELEAVCETDLHELYTTLTMLDGKVLYFHKYGGYFVDCKYTVEQPCSGGILADEMGLGKTLEVLACILLNPRKHFNPQNSVSHQDSEQPTPNGLTIDDNYSHRSSREEEIEVDDHFECACGSDDYMIGTMPLDICLVCGVIQHGECVFYDTEHISVENYICPYCWISDSKLQQSQATLIISPASIIYQWEQEISRHIKKNHLKVFMYQGVEHQKFVDPGYLSKFDIVLVSYETLKKELNHVDVPHGKSGLSLRHRKKFLAIPSPMCAVEWWRICLDEAQMVESVSSKIAKMAGRLHCVHRWCVTGTPIKKSIEDLYGLLLFLEMKPYQERVWWREVLWKPFVNGIAAPLTSALKRIAWRTTKQQVLDQLGIPPVEEVIHKLEFSAIEKVFYERQHMFCRKDFIKKITKFETLDIQLCFMDKHVLSKVMLPLRRLQFACCHFQVNQGNVDVHRKKMTTTELLEHMLKTTKYECEDAHRKFIMAVSAVAGIYFIQKDYQSAANLHEKTLKSIDDNKDHFRTDKTQQIHSLYQLSIILSMPEESEEQIQTKYSRPELEAKIQELSTEYVEKYKLTVEVCKKDITDVHSEISFIMSKFKLRRSEFPTSAWFAVVFENVEDAQRQPFVQRIEDVLKSASGKGICKKETDLVKCISRISFFELLSKLFDMANDLHETRARLKEKIESISGEPSNSDMNSVIACHLRPEMPENKKRKKCVYCEVDLLFELYQTKLYRFDVANQKPAEEEEETVCFQAARRGTLADSDLELILKFLLTYCRRIKDHPECAEDGVNEIKLFEALKKEFKFLRNLWIKSAEYVQQKDEIEMAKMSARLLLPDETPPNPPVPYILLPHEVQPKLLQNHSDIVSYHFELKKKMGQLFYLRNLEKAENKDAPFEENCPVCQQSFESSWSVLQCGHSFCLACMQTLLSSKTRFTNNFGHVCQGVRCPVCRQYTVASDVYFIDNDKENSKEDEVIIKGNYSTKTNAIVKCLLDIKKSDPGAKSLVFSNFMDFLHILEHALQENNVKCLNFCVRKHFQDQLERFKKSEDCNVLLIPLTFGCSGLNITEATNVLLVEPVLDNSKHLQAIGRVHRIGQTKKATIHRFVISNTIEENIYYAMKNSAAKENHIRSELTLQNLVDVFKDC